MLNASRHHWYFHFRAPGWCNHCVARAQRLAASLVLSPGCLDLESEGQRLCSTPRGITGTFTVTTKFTAMPELTCSTPRGITGTFTLS